MPPPRTILHFDYDSFYASVVMHHNPALAHVPLAIQQKQIIVTCNYPARARGLYKLQTVKEAKRVCPEVVIVLGEDLGIFRDASKQLYGWLRAWMVEGGWSSGGKSGGGTRAERLGFDEVWVDVTECVEWNLEGLNRSNLGQSWFMVEKEDPTKGFDLDAREVCGHMYKPPAEEKAAKVGSTETKPQLSKDEINLASSDHIRLILGSHLAEYLRTQIEEKMGYTATVGIASNKLLSKLVGNLHKPRNQTTLIPCGENGESTITTFMDNHDIGKVPGIGFKLAQKIRAHVLGRQAAFEDGIVYGPTKEKVTVRDVRLFPGIGPEMLEQLLGGPGSPRGIGGRVWDLLNGKDEAEVGKARSVPRQISIEDSYIRLDTMDEVRKELLMLSRSLIKRMRTDLTADEGEEDEPNEDKQEQTSSNRGKGTKWLAHARTLRLSTRPRPPLNPDGTRTRTFNRISHSGPMPSFVHNITDDIDSIAERLVSTTLISMFKKLHPEKSGWNLSLVNIAATNMAETASENKDSDGRDIGRMFKRQESVLKEWRVTDEDVAPSPDNEELVTPEQPVTSPSAPGAQGKGEEEAVVGNDWDSEEDEPSLGPICPVCEAVVPDFARVAHERFHEMPD